MPKIAEKLEEPLMKFLEQYERVTLGKAQGKYKELYEQGKEVQEVGMHLMSQHF